VVLQPFLSIACARLRAICDSSTKQAPCVPMSARIRSRAPAQTWLGDARRLALLLRLRPESSDLAPGTIGGSFAQP